MRCIHLATAHCLKSYLPRGSKQNYAKSFTMPWGIQRFGLFACTSLLLFRSWLIVSRYLYSVAAHYWYFHVVYISSSVNHLASPVGYGGSSVGSSFLCVWTRVVIGEPGSLPQVLRFKLSRFSSWGCVCFSNSHGKGPFSKLQEAP